MIESINVNRPIVLALGMVGQGKSTVGNMLANSPGKYFEESPYAFECT